MERPKCIVMPFHEPIAGGIGLALHFLLGNVIAVHSGFAECWFGWRVGKIFSSVQTFVDYIRMQGPSIDKNRISEQQKVRCWIYGRMDKAEVTLSFFESGKTEQPPIETIAYAVGDHLIGFRMQFIDWLERCGYPMKSDDSRTALWPERSSVEGLRRIGKALKEFYTYSAYGGPSRIDISLFDTAVSAANDSFMANSLLGWAHYRNLDITSAKRFFDRALWLNPNSPGVMSGLMWCAIKELDVDNAVHWAVKKAAAMEESVAAAAASARMRCSENGLS